MRVRATARGYHKVIREPGDEFEVPDHWSGSWFEPVAREHPHPVLPTEPTPPRRGRPPKPRADE